ncbi:MAG: hypothetical protein ANABAC_3379 [Anaerolineae bacterium]|nr:MAG: hypothetical protein ANABAC_3379 [Anaerolineae bacterium]
MNKRLIIFGVLLAALLLSAVSPWPAVLTVYNFTGDNVYITLKYRGEQKYFLTATPQGNSADYNVSVFDIVRRTYSAQVTACETTTTWGRLRMASNVRLVFPDCLQMQRVSNSYVNYDFLKDYKAWVAGTAATRSALCTKYGIPAADCDTTSATPPAQIKKTYGVGGFWGEPTMEKVTFWTDGTFEWTPDYGATWWGGFNFKDKAGTKQAFRFLYDIVP